MCYYIKEPPTFTLITFSTNVPAIFTLTGLLINVPEIFTAGFIGTDSLGEAETEEDGLCDADGLWLNDADNDTLLLGLCDKLDDALSDAEGDADALGD